MNPRIFIIIFVALFSLCISGKIIELSNGNVLVHYPLISSDGYDWYTEGAILTSNLLQTSGLSLPVLRPPLFVLAMGLDYLLWHSGFILSLIIGFSFFLNYFIALKIINEIQKERTNFWLGLPLAIGFTIYPLNYFKIYLLADSLAITLSLIGTFYLLQFMQQTSLNRKTLLISCIFFILGSLTQTYALLPLIIFTFIYWNFSAKNSIQKTYLIIATILVLASFISISFVWRSLLPHEITPNNFNSFALNLDMLDFYTQTWSYYLLPLPFLFIFPKIKVEYRWLILGFLLIGVTFLLLAFFYHWPDPRFTSYAWPWFLIGVLGWLKITPIRSILICLLLLTPFMIVPSNYWDPNWKSVRVMEFYKWNWAQSFFTLKSEDRNLNRCATSCEDTYAKKVLGLYIQISPNQTKK